MEIERKEAPPCYTPITFYTRCPALKIERKKKERTFQSNFLPLAFDDGIILCRMRCPTAKSISSCYILMVDSTRIVLHGRDGTNSSPSTRFTYQTSDMSVMRSLDTLSIHHHIVLMDQSGPQNGLAIHFHILERKQRRKKERL